MNENVFLQTFEMEEFLCHKKVMMKKMPYI